MKSELISLNYGQCKKEVKSTEIDKFQALQQIVRTQFQLDNFKIFYQLNSKEEEINDEKQYQKLIQDENVKEFVIIENKSSLLNTFIQKLFVNNQCCDNQEDGCLICFDKKKVQPEQLKELIEECLLEMLQQGQLQPICQKLFGRNVYNFDVFLEEFNNLKDGPQIQSSIKDIKSEQLDKYIIKEFTPPSKNAPISFKITEADAKKLNLITNYKKQQQHKQISSQIQQKQEQIISQKISKEQAQNIKNESSKINQESIILSRNQSVTNPNKSEYSVQYQVKKEGQKYHFYRDKPVKIDITVINNGKLRWPYGVFLKQKASLNRHLLKELNPSEKKNVKFEIQIPNSSSTNSLELGLCYLDQNKKELRIGEIFKIEYDLDEMSYKEKVDKCVELILKQQSVDDSNIKKKQVKNEVQDKINNQLNLTIEEIVNMVNDKNKLNQPQVD